LSKKEPKNQGCAEMGKQQLRPKALIKAPLLFITVVPKLNQGLPKTAVDRFRSCFWYFFAGAKSAID